MYDAFPVSLNDVQLNWGTKNEALRITVGLSFKEFTIERSTVSGPYNPSNGNELYNKKGRLNTINTDSPSQPQNMANTQFQGSVTYGASNIPTQNP